jgi:hypothetical protein
MSFDSHAGWYVRTAPNPGTKRPSPVAGVVGARAADAGVAAAAVAGVTVGAGSTF